jgi:acetylornithine deacetylase/succinyl-diaminopimelate desuccinylase-like protein
MPELKPTAHDISDVSDATADVFEKATTLLAELVAIPSLSIPGSDPTVLMESATKVRDTFAGLLSWDSIDIYSAGGGAPAVIARKDPQPGFPTVLLYAHHDVQPAGDIEQWRSDPFIAEVREGRIFGRGSADDGAGIITHYSALSVLSELVPGGGGLGVVLFVEGEEESGSPTFTHLLDDHAGLLSADLIVVADSDNPRPDIPALTTSLRGVVGVTITLRTLESSVHSGIFGGPVPDALTTVVRLLGTLHDEDGNVAVAGFSAEGSADVEVDEAQLRAESGLLEGIPLWGSGPLAARLWSKPAITVTGIDAPATSAASNTLLATASAKVSLRVPPGMPAADAKDALEAHLRNVCPHGVQMLLENWEVGEAFADDASGPLGNKVEQALRDGFGNEVVRQGLGGSIPFIAQLQAVFPKAEIAVTGVEDRDSAAHGPNESVDLGMLERAARSEALLLVRLASGV